MIHKKLIAAAAALALVAAPTIAVAQSAPPAPAPERLEGSAAFDQDLFPFFAVLAAVLLLVLATKDGDEPASP